MRNLDRKAGRANDRRAAARVNGESGVAVAVLFEQICGRNILLSDALLPSRIKRFLAALFARLASNAAFLAAVLKFAAYAAFKPAVFLVFAIFKFAPTAATPTPRILELNTLAALESSVFIAAFKFAL